MTFRTSVPIIVSFALSEEAGGLLDVMRDVQRMRCASFTEYRGRLPSSAERADEIELLVVLTGVGASRAQTAVRDALSLYDPSWWIGAGFAGGLSSALKPLDLVMAEEVLDVDTGKRLSLGLQAPTTGATHPHPLHFGTIASVAGLLSTPEQKRTTAQATGAVACDMESFVVAEVCRQFGAKCILCRVISDAASEALPPPLATIVRQASSIRRWGAVAGALWRRPSTLQDLWQLRARALLASDRLAACLLQIMPQLDV